MDYDKEIERLQKKAALLRKQKANALKRDNQQIGSYAREIFADKLPVELIDVKAFFKSLSKMLDENS